MEYKIENLLKISLFAFISLLFCSCGNNEQIEGYILDNNGKSLEGVKVNIKGSNFETMTDSNGFYALDFAQGEIEISFTKEGYFSNELLLTLYSKAYYPAADITLRSCSNHKTPRALAESVLQTMVNNDLETFSKYCLPTQNQIIAEINASTPEKIREKLLTRIKRDYQKEVHDGSTRSWDFWRNETPLSCIEKFDWSRVRAGDIEVELEKNKIGFDSAKITYQIFGGDSEPFRTLKIDAALIDGYWYFFGRMQVN